MDIKNVIVGTESALKLRAVEAALSALGFHVKPIGCKAESNVNVQPIGKKEMETGAINRAQHARLLHPSANLYIGIESGLVYELNRWYDSACTVVIAGNNNTPHIAFGAHFPIPVWMVMQVVRRNSGLGTIIRELAGGGEKDPMKWLSGSTILREQLLSQAVHCALVQILYAERFKEPI